jgi:hypothetical protein
VTISAAAELPEQVTQVVWLSWEQYLGWLAGKVRQAETAWGETVKLGKPWAPGEHMALIGTTGDGKTTHAVGVLELRKYVLALDPKGEDETLQQSGYVRVRDLPREGLGQFRGQDQRAWREIHKGIDEGRRARVIIGGGARTDAEDERLRKLMRDAITYCRHAGGWTLYVDEFELLSSQRMYHLGPLIERMLITARRDRTSVLTSFQAPAWVSKHATRQAKRTVVWPIGDPDMIKSIASGMGRNWKEVGQAVDELPPFHTLTIPRGKSGGPMVMTCAPRL